MRKILTLLLLTMTFSLFGQSNFKDGFVITKENDTIYGQIKLQTNSMNYRSCILKDGNGEHHYLPEQIRAYEFAGDKAFISGLVKDHFAEVLVTGTISLYKFEEKFYVKKGEVIQLLETGTQEIEIDGKTRLREDNRWRGILSYMISDCMPKSQQLTSRISLIERDLVNLALKYNTCQGQDFTGYKTEQPWVAFNFGISIGYNSTGLELNQNQAPLNYMDSSYQSYDPAAGILFSISSPRIAQNLALQAEMLFSQSLYTSSISGGNGSYYYDFSLETSTLSVPISVKYTLPKNKYGFFIQGGVNLDQFLKRDSFVRVRYPNNESESFQVDPEMNFSETYLGYWGGLGIYKSLKLFDASLTLRYYNLASTAGQKPGSTEGTLTSSRSNLALNLILEINENTF